MSEKQTGAGARPGRLEDVVYRLELQQCGQDLTTLYVINGVIVYSGLVERLRWEQRSLLASEFSVGDLLILRESEAQAGSIDCLIAGVERIERELTYREWLAEVDRLAWAQWREKDYTANSGANKPGDSWIESYLDGISAKRAWDAEVHAAATWVEWPVCFPHPAICGADIDNARRVAAPSSS